MLGSVHMKRRTIAAVVAAAAVTSGTIAIGAGQFASADEPSSVPWGQRPITVGSGFRLGSEGGGSAIVSTSGRWVAFNTPSVLTDDDPDLISDTYLRDRWTDRTTRINTGPAASLVMSADGNLVGGNASVYVTGEPKPTWIYNHRTGRTVELPPVDGRRQRLVGVNNDGYFLTEIDTTTTPTKPTYSTRSGRLLADGTLAPMTRTAAGDAPMPNVTPSLRYAVVPRTATLEDGTVATFPTRVDMATGAVVEPPADMVRFIGSAGSPLVRRTALMSVISPSGRYIAVTWENYWSTDEKRGWSTDVRVWDTVDGTWSVLDCQAYSACQRLGDSPVPAVLDDGRALVYLQDAGGFQSAVLYDPRLPKSTAEPVSRSFAGEPVGLQMVLSQNGPSLIARDIGRIVICGNDPLSAYDTNTRFDCYLKPFAPARVAG